VTGQHVQKRSVMIAGHASSVTLEEAFWAELKTIAAARGLSVNQLVTEIDSGRFGPQAPGSLSSAIRVFVLEWVKTGGPPA